VSGAGDVNGDGIDDVIVGARGNDAGGFVAGAAYVVFGAAPGITSINLDAVAAGIGGFKITGERSGDFAGQSVSAAGDVNGDGIDDVIVGARTSTGAAYVVFGAASGITSVNLDAVAAGTGGFKITGETLGDDAGVSVSAAGDVNGDGIDDVIVGARFNEAGGTSAGAAYVVYGAASGITSINLDDVALGIGGFRVTGEASSDFAGTSVSAAGDVNGDGFSDLIVGAYRNDGGGSEAGAAYVLFGGNFTGAVTNLGTNGADVLTGTPADDIIIAAQGNDTLNGDAGNDRLNGASGNDTLTGGIGNDVLVGGTGDDLFVFANGDGDDVIDDFVAGAGTDDVVDVTAFGFANFTALLAAASETGGNTTIALDGDDSVSLIGVRFASLHVDDFLL
jgi:Ca2+-binding RTX toxin-like protein